VRIEPIVYRQPGFDCFITVACFFHFALFLIFLSTIMAILFRIDFHEDWAVGGEKKKLPVPCKGNYGPVP
jgi:hypothetical protein